MLDENRVLCAEMLLSKFFVGKKSTTAKEAMLYVKGMMQGEGVRKSEIREARKRLSIGTEKVTEGYVWSLSLIHI